MQSADKKNMSILIVDDEPRNIQLLGNVLRDEAYQIEFATSGEEALEWVDNKKFDLVLLDIMMPGMDGIEVCRKIKANEKNRLLPIIFLTAKTDEGSVIKGFKVGAIDYIAKPFNIYELLARVETHLNLKHEQNKLKAANHKLEAQHKKLKDTQTQLIQSEKMASLGILVAGIAHEINNPANFVSVGSKNLKKYTDELKNFIFQLAGDDMTSNIEEALNEKFLPLFNNLDAMNEGTQRIKNIVKDLRTFSRLEEDEQKKVSVIEGLNATLPLAGATYKREVTFITDFSVDPVIECWPAQLNQVFLNLIINGCQAIIEKKKTDPSLEGKLVISTFIQDQQLAIRFSDNGCGMAEESKEQIFDPFFTTKKVGEGTGLGLSISFGIIEKHKGSLIVESSSLKGTSILLILPIKL
jgi:two-component system, NtrC family, sensor kinase